MQNYEQAKAALIWAKLLLLNFRETKTGTHAFKTCVCLFEQARLSGSGTGLPAQGSHIQNHWVAPRSTQPSEVDQMSTRNFWELSGKK